MRILIYGAGVIGSLMQHSLQRMIQPTTFAGISGNKYRKRQSNFMLI